MFGFVTLRMRFSGSCISLCAARNLCEGRQLLPDLARNILRKHNHASRVLLASKTIPIKIAYIMKKYASPVCVCVCLCILMRLRACDEFFNL